MAQAPRPLHLRTIVVRSARTGITAALALAMAWSFAMLVAIAPPDILPAAAVQAAQSGPRLDKPSIPVRVRVPSVGIDLPVVSSERKVRGNPPGDTLCDVAQYWTKYDLPGTPGTTWIYAHAQPGMFLPLFTESEATGGTGLIGDIVELQLRDGRLLRYRVIEVRERATGQRIAVRPYPGQHRLVLQTSTGPQGTIPKLQVAARLVEATRTSAAAPKAKPRACWQSRVPGNGDGRDPTAAATQTEAPATVVQPVAEAIDPATVVVVSGAVLLSATLVAVFLVRRQP